MNGTAVCTGNTPARQCQYRDGGQAIRIGKLTNGGDVGERISERGDGDDVEDDSDADDVLVSASIGSRRRNHPVCGHRRNRVDWMLSDAIGQT